MPTPRPCPCCPAGTHTPYGHAIGADRPDEADPDRPEPTTIAEFAFAVEIAAGPAFGRLFA